VCRASVSRWRAVAAGDRATICGTLRISSPICNVNDYPRRIVAWLTSAVSIKWEGYTVTMVLSERVPVFGFVGVLALVFALSWRDGGGGVGGFSGFGGRFRVDGKAVLRLAIPLCVGKLLRVLLFVFLIRLFPAAVGTLRTVALPRCVGAPVAAYIAG